MSVIAVAGAAAAGPTLRRLRQRLTAPDGTILGHGSASSLSMSGDTLVVGNPDHAVNGQPPGRVRPMSSCAVPNGAWTLQQELAAPDGSADASSG